MSKLTKEQFEELPEFLKSDYVEQGDHYVHAGFVKVKQTADDLDKRAKEREQELEEYRKLESERIAEAERKAYEKAKKEGNTDELEKRWQEKLADAEKRRGETEKQFQDRLQRLAHKQRKAVASELSDIATDNGRAAFKRLIESYIEVDPETDDVTFLDDNGRATSLSKEAFIKELENNPVFAPLIKAKVATQGGGGANGSGGGRAATKKFDEMSGAELSALRKDNPQEYDRLKTEFQSRQ